MNKRCSNVDVYEQKVYLSINAIALLDIEAPQMKCDDATTTEEKIEGGLQGGFSDGLEHERQLSFWRSRWKPRPRNQYPVHVL